MTVVTVSEKAAVRLDVSASGDTEARSFDSLVIATANTVNDRQTRELVGGDHEIQSIGDTVAACREPARD